MNTGRNGAAAAGSLRPRSRSSLTRRSCNVPLARSTRPLEKAVDCNGCEACGTKDHRNSSVPPALRAGVRARDGAAGVGRRPRLLPGRDRSTPAHAGRMDERGGPGSVPGVRGRAVPVPARRPVAAGRSHCGAQSEGATSVKGIMPQPSAQLCRQQPDVTRAMAQRMAFNGVDFAYYTNRRLIWGVDCGINHLTDAMADRKRADPKVATLRD